MLVASCDRLILASVFQKSVLQTEDQVKPFVVLYLLLLNLKLSNFLTLKISGGKSNQKVATSAIEY